jgi:hypothetical protein
LPRWLYATCEGVGSARALDRLCDEHDAYRWICGGVGVNYHTPADSRVTNVGYRADLPGAGDRAVVLIGSVPRGPKSKEDPLTPERCRLNDAQIGQWVRD